MNPLILQLKKLTVLYLTVFALGCFALSPQTQAVSPPDTPDPGPLPISNTADGQLALSGVTGLYNSAFGIYACLSNGAAKFNTGIGADTLVLNTADENTATGAGALFSNTLGNSNTANGAFALFSNSGSEGSGNNNTAIGDRAMQSNTTGSDNTAIGKNALLDNTTGDANTAIGRSALVNNTTGINDTAVGSGALGSNTTGNLNTAMGYKALTSNTTGNDNTANGREALFFNTTGNNNAANGVGALSNNDTGDNNTGIGPSALASNTTGSSNTALGSGAGGNVATADNVTCIGSNVAGADVSDTTWIGNVFAVTTISGTTAPVIVSDTGQLGTLVSSERFKKDIATMDKASEAILSLRPVRFHYKTDTKGTPQFGLIAEEVAKVNPALVIPDKEGKPYTVRYDAVNAMLLNEFLKEHQTVQELKKEVAALTAGLQKVSAQLEVNKAAPQTVLNNH